MKTEASAGGVVVANIQNQWHVLLIQDMNKSWTFPKGLIEKNEDPQDTAVREILEETGLADLTYLSPLGTISYMYRKNGLIGKTVHYFLFQSNRKMPPVPQKEEGIRQARWVTFNEAHTMIGYTKTNKRLLQKAIEGLRAI